MRGIGCLHRSENFLRADGLPRVGTAIPKVGWVTSAAFGYDTQPWVPPIPSRRAYSRWPTGWPTAARGSTRARAPERPDITLAYSRRGPAIRGLAQPSATVFFGRVASTEAAVREYPPGEDEIIAAFVKDLNQKRGAHYAIIGKPDDVERNRPAVDYIIADPEPAGPRPGL